MSETKKKAAAAGDMDILRALLAASVSLPESEMEKVVWRVYSFEPDALFEQLVNLVPKPNQAIRRRLKTFSAEFASRYRLRVSKSGDLPISLAGQSGHLPRWLVGEALGALGTNLMPTRQRSRRVATEAAREMAYFGYGQLAEQILPHPIALIRAALAGEQDLYLEPTLLDETGPSLGRRWSVFDLLKKDSYFHRPMDGEAALARFQQFLREDPLDGAMVVALRQFFSKRATVGLRDTTRWVLGSRHPWFNWKRARKLIDDCFERWGTENFLSPRFGLYAPDVSLSDEQLDALREANERVVAIVAKELAARISPSVARKLDPDQLTHLARAALDCHHDHPDFDLEARGRQGGETTARFLGHAMYVLATNMTGHQHQARPNVNLAAHFEEKGVEGLYLDTLDGDERASFYMALNDLMKEYGDRAGVIGPAGPDLAYQRLPLRLYSFYEAPTAHPKKDEKVVDSFTLAELREPQHARNLQENPEIFEKLVVFYTLVLRHFLDTEHVPDLRPENLVRDFMVLGLWGTNTQNLVINLYSNKTTGKTRTEVRFVGRSQVKDYRPDEDRKHEASLARLIFSQVGPLLKPSVLRSVSTFLMAAEESTQGSRVQEMGSIALAKHTLELFREAARTGIKGSLVDLATLLEMLVDNSVDIAQQGLDRIAK